jgi:N-glycosylase/DNA lyase
MHPLTREIRKLQGSAAGKKVRQRLHEFRSFKDRGSREWFSELCFCLLTANSKAETALEIQRRLGARGFCNACASRVKNCIRSAKHRFHNNKTRFIIEARKHADIKPEITAILENEGEEAAREWLVENIRGMGYKEASHFLRNVGCSSLAILDRHILNLMHENGIIVEKPKALARKKYLEIEGKFRGLARQLEMYPAELDLYMWYMKTGKVLK